MLFHAKHASENGFTYIVVITPDTDVAIICMSFSHQMIATLYLKIGSGSKLKILDINKMKQNLELHISSKVNRSADELCDAILGLHAFTGCDSVSAFAGKGKSKAIKILITSDEYIDLFKNFGQQWQVNKDEMAALECFTCELYNGKYSGGMPPGGGGGGGGGGRKKQAFSKNREETSFFRENGSYSVYLKILGKQSKNQFS